VYAKTKVTFYSDCIYNFELGFYCYLYLTRVIVGCSRFVGHMNPLAIATPIIKLAGDTATCSNITKLVEPTDHIIYTGWQKLLMLMLVF